jgi:hypothetical protein
VTVACNAGSYKVFAETVVLDKKIVGARIAGDAVLMDVPVSGCGVACNAGSYSKR